MYTVVFRTVHTGITLRRRFDSMYLCRNFINKLKHSKRVVLVSYPILS